MVPLQLLWWLLAVFSCCCCCCCCYQCRGAVAAAGVHVAMRRVVAVIVVGAVCAYCERECLRCVCCSMAGPWLRVARSRRLVVVVAGAPSDTILPETPVVPVADVTPVAKVEPEAHADDVSRIELPGTIVAASPKACTQVYEIVYNKKCTTTHEKACTVVHETKHETKYEKVCETTYNKDCKTNIKEVPDKQCTTVSEKACVKVPITTHSVAFKDQCTKIEKKVSNPSFHILTIF